MVSNFGRNLKALREDNDMTQQELADALGFTQTSVGGWETRSKHPRKSTISAICEYFGVTEDDLVSGSSGYYAKRYVMPQPKTSDTFAPVAGSIAAGSSRHAFELSGETHWVNPSVLDSYPDGFFVRVAGDSMNLSLPDGSFAFVAPVEVRSGDIAAVKVNGDDATVKRVKLMDGLVILEPESSNPEHKRKIIDGTDPDAPDVRLLGKVVWADLSL